MKKKDAVALWFIAFVMFLIAMLGFLVPPAQSQALPVPIPTVTIEVPGPVRTILERVEVPGPTVTVPGPTVTETVFVPGPTETVTVPGPTVTETVTLDPDVTPTGQPTESSATVTVTPEPIPTPTPQVIEREGPERTVEVGVPTAIGLGALVALMAIALVGVFLAYYRGYKDSDEANKKLLARLRDDILGR